MTAINPSARALKAMSGASWSLNVTDADGRSISPLIRISWECSPTLDDAARERIESDLACLLDGISDRL